MSFRALWFSLVALPLVMLSVACGGSSSTTPTPTPPVPTPTPAPRPSPPFTRGPDPSVEGLEAEAGPFSVASLEVTTAEAKVFSGGTVSYPTGTNEGPFGVVAITPGYTGVRYSMSWLGPRLASHGFVVIVIDTASLTDNAEARASQLLAAASHVTLLGNTAGHALHGRVDGFRRGVMGHSYGGGGALVAGRTDPSLKAVIPLAPYYESTSFSDYAVPALIVGCELDAVASVDRLAIPMYNSIPATVSKAYLELAGGDHLCVETGKGNKAIQGKYAAAWLKRFLDDDTRYSPYLCGAPHAGDVAGPALSDYMENCPY